MSNLLLYVIDSEEKLLMWYQKWSGMVEDDSASVTTV